MTQAADINMVLDAIDQAHEILCAHLEPNGRSAEETIANVLTALDSDKLFATREPLEHDAAAAK